MFTKKHECLRCCNFCFSKTEHFQLPGVGVGGGGGWVLWNSLHCDSVKTFYVLQCRALLSEIHVLFIYNQDLEK